MSTKNIVPRADGEGSLGTAAKRWSNVQTKKVTSEGEVSAGSVSSTGTISAASATIAGKDIQSTLLASNAGAHNGIFRGKNLGSSLTEAQSAAIQAGTFDDLYIGDYWTIGGVDYVIVAFDYYYNTGDTACTTHHAVVVPRNPLYNAQMNTTNVVTGAYVGSAMYTTNLNNAKTTIQNAFGSTHLLTIRQLFQNSVAESGYENSIGEWYDATVWLMNEFNVYGGIVWKNAFAATNWRGNYTIDNSQYPGFALDPTMIHTPSRNAYWLRDVASSTDFAFVNGDGNCSSDAASNSYGVRPAFCIK